jgi:hypothetical protein
MESRWINGIGGLGWGRREGVGARFGERWREGGAGGRKLSFAGVFRINCHRVCHTAGISNFHALRILSSSLAPFALVAPLLLSFLFVSVLAYNGRVRLEMKVFEEQAKRRVRRNREERAGH